MHLRICCVRLGAFPGAITIFWRGNLRGNLWRVIRNLPCHPPPTTSPRERETRKVAWEINGFSLRVIWPANLACMNNVGMAWAHSGLCDRSPTPWSLEACLPCRDRVQSAERRCMHPFSIPFCLSSLCVINPPRVNLRCDKIHLAQARSDQIRGLDLFDSRFTREWLPLGRR
jgi:hypothetical protein